jgi:hypothetical protein
MLLAGISGKQYEPENRKTPQKQGFRVELDGIEPTQMQGICWF